MKQQSSTVYTRSSVRGKLKFVHVLDLLYKKDKHYYDPPNTIQQHGEKCWNKRNSLTREKERQYPWLSSAESSYTHTPLLLPPLVSKRINVWRNREEKHPTGHFYSFNDSLHVFKSIQHNKKQASSCHNEPNRSWALSLRLPELLSAVDEIKSLSHAPLSDHICCKAPLKW